MFGPLRFGALRFGVLRFGALRFDALRFKVYLKVWALLRIQVPRLCGTWVDI